MTKPLMAKATAVWLIDNTTLSFAQIADFCGLHELEVQGIADGDVATGMKGYDPVANSQLELSEVRKAEAEPAYRMKLKHNPAAVGEEKRRGPRYTPLSKRQDRPAAILWLVKFHPELADAQIRKLVGTTNPTIQAIRDRTHWNIQSITPIDPVALGLCRQGELDAEVQKAAKRRDGDGVVLDDEARRRLVSTTQSLDTQGEARLPSSIAGLENFSLSETDEQERPDTANYSDADSFFNLPRDDADDDAEDEGGSGRSGRR